MATHAESRPELPVAADRLHRITFDVYSKMGQLGLIAKADRVVLIDGLLVKKMTKGPRHTFVVQNVVDLLEGLGLEGLYVRKEDPIALPNGPDGHDDAPEPDVVLARGSKQDYRDHHPGSGEIALIVEVSDTTLRDDRSLLARYAWAGIPVVWIVNLNDGTIEVYETPLAAVDDPRYGDCRVRGDGDEVEVTADGQVLGRVRVSDVLP